jgi:hypothetical protein
VRTLSSSKGVLIRYQTEELTMKVEEYLYTFTKSGQLVPKGEVRQKQ